MIIFEFTKTYVIYCNYFCNMYHGQDAGQLCIGLNTQPFSPNHALLKWTDQSDDALSEIRYEILLLMYNNFRVRKIFIRSEGCAEITFFRFIGFTASEDANVYFGVDCILQTKKEAQVVYFDTISTYTDMHRFKQISFPLKKKYFSSLYPRIRYWVLNTTKVFCRIRLFKRIQIGLHNQFHIFYHSNQ